MPDLTTHSSPYDPLSLAAYLRDRGFPIAGLPEAPHDDADEPDDPQQAGLPTGPTHVVARGTPDRTKDQVASARKFIAAAGCVTFDTGQATLRAVWMTFAYYASLGDGRVCFAQVKTIATHALVSERTVRRCVLALIDRGLIESDNRKGGHAPTTWTVHAFSPSVLGGQDGRAGRPEWPGRADRMSADISNRGSSSKKKKEPLASKQPDGACAPPADTKKPAATNDTTTATPEPTHAAEQTGGGVHRGASEKQIKFLRILADRVGADHDESAWRAADRKRVQAQMDAGKPFKDLHFAHRHAAVDEEFHSAGIHCAMSFKACGQRCACGSYRFVRVTRSGPVGGEDANPWTFSGHLLDGITWAPPMSFSEVEDRVRADTELTGRQ